MTIVTDGQKATKMRSALQAALDNLPDTAHEPRATLRKMMEMPAVVLSIFHDAMEWEV